nr:MAG TPA: hypothetical protein [Caudoviricetes sp.]
MLFWAMKPAPFQVAVRLVEPCGGCVETTTWIGCFTTERKHAGAEV